LSPFSVFYYLLSGLLYIVALPLLIILSFKQKYKESLPARFFLFRNPRFSPKEGIWFHVCSLGEARALQPLLERINSEDIKITTITHTGFAEAKKYKVQTRYLPYELFLPFWMRKERLLVVMEAEFWYMLFLVARLRGTKIFLLNARISDKSVKKYLQFGWFYKKLFDCVEIIYAQSETDKNRFLAMGAKNIEVIGNIKLSQKIVRTKEYVKPSCEVIVGASTHATEEEAILKAFVEYKKQQKDAKLLLVPRHPERFDAVFGLMSGFASQHAMACSRFSQSASFDGDMVLIDAMGELNNIYAISDIAILGGAFREDVGGHNPLEPAHFGCKIITGKHFFHQKELFKYVHHVQYVATDGIHKALLACKELPPSIVEETIDLQSVVEKILEK